MKVHSPHITGAHEAASHATARSEAQKKSSGVSFAEQLATASTKKKSSTTDAKATTPPKGEETKAVAGQTAYRDIVAGPREGMYLNTSGNVRNGQAFVMVKRHGVEYHIYGTGKDKRVVAIKHHHHHATPPASSAPTSTAPTSGTTDTSSTTTSSPTQTTPTA
jgi:hypothetical protein